ncbi:MAG: sporulation protein YqfC [Bacillota bacterium]
MRTPAGRNRIDGVQEKVVDLFEIPKHALLDIPRVVLVGNAELVLENHMGILEYREDRIRVATGRGEITVEGKGLSIARILKREIAIEGQIRRLDLWR